MEDSEEEEDGLEYETDTPLWDSYMTPPSTGGCSKPSPGPSQSPTLEGSDPETSGALCTTELEARIEVFLEEVEEDLEMDDMPPLENVMSLPVPAPFPGFVPFAVSTSQCCIPPKTLLNKVFHPRGEARVLLFSTRKTYPSVFISVLRSTPNVLKSSTLYDTEVICSVSGFITKKTRFQYPRYSF